MIDYHESADELVRLFKTLSKLDTTKSFNAYTHGEKSILSYLSHHQDETIVPSDIGDYSHISSARVANVLNKLEEKSLISRAIDPADRRRILVKITPEGLKRAAEEKEKSLAVIVQILEEMGEDKSKEFLQSWKCFVEAGRKINQKIKEKEEA